jgi:NAD(P)-dependent dehydrogenase (short-subunit alcohol dehydrogenase family)
VITGTPMVDYTLANFPGLLQPYIDTIPLGRPGRADEVGNVVAFLCPDAASFITGHSLAIDGGQMAL